MSLILHLILWLAVGGAFAFAVHCLWTAFKRAVKRAISSQLWGK